MQTAPAGKSAWNSPDNLIFIFLGLFAFSVFFSVTAVEAALLLVLLFLLIKMHREGTLGAIRPALTGHPLFLPWLAYLAVCLLTSITAYYPGKAFGQFNSDLLKYICLSTLLLAVKKDHLPRLSAIYIAAAALSSIFGICEAVRPVLDGGVLARAGAFMNAVRYGEALAIALLLILARLTLSPKITTRERALHLSAALLVFTALLLTQTRGAYLGLAAGIITMFCFAAGARKKLALYSAGLLAVGCLLFSASPSIKARFSRASVTVSADVSANSPATGGNVRLALWKLGYKMVKTHPVLGVGPGNIKKVFKKFHPEPFPEEGIYGTLNNLYIQQAAERGLPGLGVLLLLLAALIKFALTRFRVSGSPYALWPLCALPAFLFVNLTEISFQHVHTAFAIFLALAFAAAAEKETA